MVFPLGVSVQGDVVVSVYHMRSTIGGRLQAKVHVTSFFANVYLIKCSVRKGKWKIEITHNSFFFNLMVSQVSFFVFTEFLITVL